MTAITTNAKTNSNNIQNNKIKTKRPAKMKVITNAKQQQQQ